jgi:type II secretory pathway component GspD/PulD (secretin)
MGGGYGMNQTIGQNLRWLLMNTIEPDTWYELSDTGEGTITPYPDQQPKKLAIYQTPEVHQQIADLLDQMRKSLGQQVSIEARFLIVSENFLEDIGVDLDLLYNLGGKWGQLSFEQTSYDTAAPDISTKIPGSLGQIGAAATMTGGYGSVLDNLQASFLLRATQGRADSKVLTAPKVTVLSGESAMFYLLDTVSYALPPEVAYGTQAGAYPGGGGTTSSIQQQVGMVYVGSALTITPTIAKDKKNVLLNIMTTQQDLLRFRTHHVEGPVGTAGEVVEYDVTVPETETSQVMTRVSVPDSGTLLLGGQKITAEVEKEVGVPVLSKIPIIGRAFSNRSTIRDHKILLILVKPVIILQEEREKEAIAAMESGL